MKQAFTLVLLTISSSLVLADDHAGQGPFSFEPLTQSGITGTEPACAPFKLPAGFDQVVLIEELDTCGPHALTLDVVAGDNDWTDMNTVNETGANTGRFLYRTHENGSGRAAISVVDLKTGDSATYTAADFGIDPLWSRLDGLEWTPWGTILIAEENGSAGRLFECEVDGLDIDCVDRPAVGRMSHEGIAVSKAGDVYVGDELNGGSIYRFVPDSYGDLGSGILYGLNIPDEGADGIDGTGEGEWVTLVPGANGVITDPSINARAAADEAGLTDYLRPEDAQIIGPNLYFATTTDNRVVQIPINTETPFVTEFFGVNVGNVNAESDVPEYGLRSPDNLAADSAGNLYIVEDNSGNSDIWVAGKDRDHDGVSDSVSLFATLTTPGAEATGIYFSRGMPHAMFVNVQHAADGNDLTVLLTRNSRHDHDDRGHNRDHAKGKGNKKDAKKGH